MWGAVIGDIVGSRFEGGRGGPKDFELFHRHCRYTDDTVCTAAVADILLNDRKPDWTLQDWCRRHRGRGYGGFFRKWIASADPVPYGSFGNGAAMRVAPVALLHRQRPFSGRSARVASDRVTEITHDHPEGIKGRPSCNRGDLARPARRTSRKRSRREITTRYGYDLEREPRGHPAIPPVRCHLPRHGADSAHRALESTSLKDAVRNAVSLGGDADTVAAIAGALGEALHGLPEGLVKTVRERYLQDAEDITGALDGLYERATCELTPETHRYESDRMG